MNEIASRYAYALYSLALEKDQLEERVKQIKELLDVLEDNGDFLLLLSNEFLSIEERQEVVHKALQGVNEDILLMIDIVIKNHRVKYLMEILQAFITDANSYQGVKEGLLYSSMPLDKNTISRIEKAIGKKEGCKVYLKPIVDQTLIGGVRILINDHIYDSSIISQLERMKSKLLRNEG